MSLFARPRGAVGLWLPNNVSLLGPLMLIVVSLSGNPLCMKAGSRSEDLTGVFLEFARNHSGDGGHILNQLRVLPQDLTKLRVEHGRYLPGRTPRT